MKTKERDSSFEALRILTMLMIVIWHVGVHGVEGYIDVQNLTGVNHFIYHLVKSITVPAVNLYVLISGYFLCKSRFKLTKVIRLVLETFIFSNVIYLISVLVGEVNFSIGSFVFSFFPIFFGSYWFVSVYLVLFLLFPFLNMLINNMEKLQHLQLLLILFFVNSIWQFIYVGVDLGVAYGKGILHFIFLYLLASYMRNYSFSEKFKKRSFLITGFIALAIINTVLFTIVNSQRFFINNSPVVVLMAVLLFLAFKEMSFTSSMINRFSKYVFGIYLIHDHNLGREVLWNEWGIVESILNNEALMIFKTLGYGVLIFLVCWVMSFVIGSFFNLAFEFVSEKADFSHFKKK